MVETDFSGDFLNADNCKKGDIIVITGEGDYVEIESNGKKKRVLNVPVEINGSSKTWSPFTDDGKAWVKAFGKNTKNWIGKKGKIDLVSYMSYGQKKQAISVEPILEIKI